ncbi:hypothetical protein B1207_15365 [Legionella quinlivanii]|uniref:DUF3775 domain-containing protein n=1 Tax=Legionella quinlivanii TaxID=45073 RepID=A0A364LFB6_9GAMM|nr:DUF3775 domain-containing protein [Legionella quinlivanii]RAP34653.1 hypothetical protein B1207_15365 [Legionella quinlivanii]
MLNIHPKKIRAILEEIERFQEKEDQYPKLTTEKDTPYILSDPWYQSTLGTINSLTPSQQATLVALMYLGHGDFEKNEWSDALSIAQEQQTKHIAQYLLSVPNVVSYIENGLNILGFIER